MNVWKSENEPYYIIFERNERVTAARKKAALIVILNHNFHFGIFYVHMNSKRNTKNEIINK